MNITHIEARSGVALRRALKLSALGVFAVSGLACGGFSNPTTTGPQLGSGGSTSTSNGGSTSVAGFSDTTGASGSFTTGGGGSTGTVGGSTGIAGLQSFEEPSPCIAPAALQGAEFDTESVCGFIVGEAEEVFDFDDSAPLGLDRGHLFQKAVDGYRENEALAHAGE